MEETIMATKEQHHLDQATSSIAAADASPKEEEAKKKRQLNPPPEGYVCNLCNEPGHWIFKCSQRSNNNNSSKKRKKKNLNHEYQQGFDPSEKDIEQAKKMQQIKPPPCDCDIPSRLKKVKRSKVSPENSRAIGSYFFFCNKKKDDPTKCNFAQPVEELEKSKEKKAQANFFAKKRKS
jgi:Zinc knuckle